MRIPERDSGPNLVEPPPFEPELLEVPAIDSARRIRGLIFVGLACASVAFAMSIQAGLNANFLKEDIGATGGQVGYLEAARETCGITAFGLLALLAGMGEPMVAVAVLVLFSIGLGGYAFADNYMMVVLMSIVWSQGLHIWMPLPNSMTLSLAEPGRAGHRLGQIQAAGSAGFVIGLLAALGMNYFGMQMRQMYLVAAAAGMVGVVACLAIPRDIKTPGPRMVLRKKYSLYYLLCFLEGWRKQIAIAFSAFMLVKVYGASLKEILVLMMVVQAIGYVSSPAVGRLIDRVGEKPVLTFYYLSLAVLFVGYATVQSRYPLYGIFILDNAFFVFSMALTTYVNRIAPKLEHTPTLSAGVAFNHIAAVAMPFLGGIVWDLFGFKWTFLIGAFAAAVSVAAVQIIPKKGSDQAPA